MILYRSMVPALPISPFFDILRGKNEEQGSRRASSRELSGYRTVRDLEFKLASRSGSAPGAPMAGPAPRPSQSRLLPYLGLSISACSEGI